MSNGLRHSKHKTVKLHIYYFGNVSSKCLTLIPHDKTVLRVF
jgi:hypothetical protein